MQKRSVGRLAAVTIALGAALAWAHDASAAGAVNISSCQVLDIPNTTYKLTADLITDCTDCLGIAASKVTIDLQNHTITDTSGCFFTAGIREFGNHDSIVIKNGTISGYGHGLDLENSTRVSVLGIVANYNRVGMSVGGAKALIKSSVANSNEVDGIQVGFGAQIQQSDASGNGQHGIVTGSNCLITKNTAISNGGFGIETGGNCTVSFNTANNNDFGIGVGTAGSNAAGNLATRNTAIGNLLTDFLVFCPSEVTFNTSTGPGSYDFFGSPPCKTAHNN